MPLAAGVGGMGVPGRSLGEGVLIVVPPWCMGGLPHHAAAHGPAGRGAPPAHPPPCGQQAARQIFNHWVRTSGAFDGVVDFDAAVRDPAQADRLLPTYDSGGHLHPNTLGRKAMARAVPLRYFR